MTLREASEILVAGIGGASLGTELMKCLRFAGRYRIIGCDITDSVARCLKALSLVDGPP